MGSSKGQGQTKAVCALPHMSHTSGPVGFIMLLDTYSENGFSFSFRFFFFFFYFRPKIAESFPAPTPREILQPDFRDPVSGRCESEGTSTWCPCTDPVLHPSPVICSLLLQRQSS